LDRESTETRKRIVAALQSGRRFMHFANTAGDIKNDVFECRVVFKTGQIQLGRLLNRSRGFSRAVDGATSTE
jgi:hypothetical protein